MELHELDLHERTVLAAGLKLTVLADARASQGEAVAIDRIATALGHAAYDSAMDRAAVEASDGASFAALAGTVTRSDARELIYGTLLDVALADSVTPGDPALLDDLARLWGLQVKIADTEELGPPEGVRR